ncbi:hypothetical protein SUNI508_06718 [Seiridium unicorne]|uniref:Uncharacterized protein n=1 Tax=Seiridium unicorne TaxID=138068 RepID=A0ABR2UZR6_9PEZI
MFPSPSPPLGSSRCFFRPSNNRQDNEMALMKPPNGDRILTSSSSGRSFTSTAFVGVRLSGFAIDGNPLVGVHVIRHGDVWVAPIPSFARTTGIMHRRFCASAHSLEHTFESGSAKS